MLRICLITLISLVARFAAASTSPIYTETYARCSQTQRVGNAVNVARVIWKSFSIQTVGDGFGQALQVVTINPAAIAEILQTRGLSPRVSMMLSSRDFSDALNDCYGASDLLKRTYISGLVLSDISGKVAAGAMVVASGWLTGKIFASLVRAYPLAKYGIFSLSMSGAVTQAVTTYRELTRDATPEERAAVEKMVADPISRGDEIVREVEQRLELEITRMNALIPTLSGSEHEAAAARLERLNGHLNKLKLLDRPPTALGELK